MQRTDRRTGTAARVVPLLLAAVAGLAAAEVEAIPVQDAAGSHDIYLETFTHVGRVRPNSRGGEDYFDENGRYAGRSEASATGAIRFYDRDGIYTGEMVVNHSTGFDAFGPDGAYLGQAVSGFRGIPEYFDVRGTHLPYSLFLVTVSGNP